MLYISFLHFLSLLIPLEYIRACSWQFCAISGDVAYWCYVAVLHIVEPPHLVFKAQSLLTPCRYPSILHILAKGVPIQDSFRGTLQTQLKVFSSWIQIFF